MNDDIKIIQNLSIDLMCRIDRASIDEVKDFKINNEIDLSTLLYNFVDYLDAIKG